MPGGVFLLAEPEAPLSPQNLLASPGARIYAFDSVPVRAVQYEELPHVTLTRDFLNAPDR